MSTDPHDLAKRRHVVRVRIHGDERKLAVAYPDERAQLESDLEKEGAMLAELDEQLAAADEAVCAEYREAVERVFSLRDTLLKLRGHFNDPGFKDGVFVKPYLSRSAANTGPFGTNMAMVEAQETLQVKQALLGVVNVEPAPEVAVSDSQRLHEERVRNERAGLGYWTDAELEQRANDPDGFEHGAGFRRARQMSG